MKKSTSQLSLNFIITWIILPLCLFLFWAVFSFFFLSKYSLTVLAVPHGFDSLSNYKFTELLAKEKITGSIVAKDNNLGIVSVRFYNFQRISSDSVIFRIKEANATKWYYQGQYTVNQFQPNELFTFGFPLILDSKGNKYVYEIESIKGKQGNAISLSDVYPPVVSQYQYSKSELFGNKSELILYVFKKLYYSFTDRNFLIASFIYILPMVFYLLWCWYAKVKIGVQLDRFPRFTTQASDINSDTKSNPYILVHVFILSVIGFVFFMEVTNIPVTIMLVLLWIWLCITYKFDSSVSYFMALVFMILCPILLILDKESMAQRSALWVYFLLLIGTLHSAIEFSRKSKRRVDYKIFVSNVIESAQKYRNIGRKR